MPTEVGEDPVIVPVTTTTVDENGNTVVTGYPSSGSSAVYTGPVSTSPYESGLGIGLGEEGGTGEPGEPS